jgi:hypothetical protein
VTAHEEADDAFLWNYLKVVQDGMFATGPVRIKFAYFGREGALQTRPCITTNWISDPCDMSDVMDRARAGCVCGCYVNVGDILAHALKEAQQRPVQAVVIIGDHFHGNLEGMVASAKKLRVAGARLFLFQQSEGRGEQAFRIAAAVTGGAYLQFNPHVERVAKRLPGLLEAVAHFAIGGMEALEAQVTESAALLLEKMNVVAQGEQIGVAGQQGPYNSL